MESHYVTSPFGLAFSLYWALRCLRIVGLITWQFRALSVSISVNTVIAFYNPTLKVIVSLSPHSVGYKKVISQQD